MKPRRNTNTYGMRSGARKHSLMAAIALLMFIAAMVVYSFVMPPPSQAQTRVMAAGGVSPISLGLVISQVYGGGGNSGAPFNQDFIELFNRSKTAVTCNGCSVQYASGNSMDGTNFTVTALPNITLQPGQYYLIGEASGANGAALPTPDATGTTNLAATAGKVALVNGTTPINVACPAMNGTGTNAVLDFVGYGTTATTNCSETAPAPAPSSNNTRADIRNGGGSTDTGNNSTDFQALAPTPRNTSSNAGIPTAATGTINGLVAGKDGAPLSGVTITLTGSKDSVRAITDANGLYSFADLETEDFYVVTPSRVDYTFSPENRAFSLLGGKVSAPFAATPSTTATANPLDTAEFFVRQQYVDFLNREPDAGGLAYWSAQLANCKDDAACLRRKRIDVAAAFFIEQEFQQTGSYVYRVFKASTGNAPTYTEYMQGRNRIIGGGGLEAAQVAFSEAGVNAAYANWTDAQYVDQLYANASIAAPARVERDALLAGMKSGAETRASVLGKIANNAAFQQQDYAKAFVLAEYFSYLKRDSDNGGYAFWLDVLNNKAPGNYRSMVCAFVTSIEYQKRFSPVVTHSDAECGQ